MSNCGTCFSWLSCRGAAQRCEKRQKNVSFFPATEATGDDDDDIEKDDEEEEEEEEDDDDILKHLSSRNTSRTVSFILEAAIPLQGDTFLKRN